MHAARATLLAAALAAALAAGPAAASPPACAVDGVVRAALVAEPASRTVGCAAEADALPLLVYATGVGLDAVPLPLAADGDSVESPCVPGLFVRLEVRPSDELLAGPGCAAGALASRFSFEYVPGEPEGFELQLGGDLAFETEVRGSEGPLFPDPPAALVRHPYAELMTVVGAVPAVAALGRCSGAPLVSVFSLLSFSPLPEGGYELVREWAARDECGTRGSVLQTVVVLPPDPCAGDPCRAEDGATGNECAPAAGGAPEDYACACNTEGGEWLAGPGALSCQPVPRYGTCAEPRRCRELNFDGHLPGANLDRQYADLGVWIRSDDAGLARSAAFDSGAPTGGARRLGSPNEGFGGPGSGAAGTPSGALPNEAPLRGVLIVAEEPTAEQPASEPRPRAAGGTLVFSFARPVDVASVGLLNADVRGAQVLVRRGEGGALEQAAAVPADSEVGPNGAREVPVGAAGVTELRVSLGGPAAVTRVVFCEGAAGAGQTHDFTDAGAVEGVQVRPPSANTYGEFASAFHPDQVSSRDRDASEDADGRLVTELCFTLSGAPCGGADADEADEAAGPQAAAARAPARPMTDRPFEVPNGTEPECSYYRAVSGEVWSEEPFRYGTVRFTTRPEPRAGVVSSVFTFHGLGPPQETAHQLIFSFAGLATRRVVTDIKVWPRGGGAPRDYAQVLDLPFDWSEEEHTYAIVWREGLVEWWADETLLRRVTSGTHEPVPEEAGRVMAHSWAVSGNQVADEIREVSGEYDWSDASEHRFCLHCLQFVRDSAPEECDAVDGDADEAGADADADEADADEAGEACPSAVFGTHAPDLVAQYNRDSGALTLEAYSAFHPEAQLVLMITADAPAADAAVCDCDAAALAAESCFVSVPLDGLLCEFSDSGPPTATDQCALNSPRHPQFSFDTPWHLASEGRCGLRAQLHVPFDTLVSECGSVLRHEAAPGLPDRPAVRFSGNFYAAVITPKPHGKLTLTGVPSREYDHLCDMYPAGFTPDVEATGGCGNNPIVDSTVERIGSCVSNFTERHCYTAVDGCGESVTKCYSNHYQDILPPTVSVPTSSVTVQCGEVPPPTGATVEDECNPYVNLVVEEDPPASARGPCDSYDRVLTAVDSCGFRSEGEVRQRVNVVGTAAGVDGDDDGDDDEAGYQGALGSPSRYAGAARARATGHDVTRAERPRGGRVSAGAAAKARAGTLTDVQCGCGCEKVNSYSQSVYFEFDVAFSVATELLGGGDGDDDDDGQSRKDAAADAVDTSVELVDGMPALVLTPRAGAGVRSIAVQGEARDLERVERDGGAVAFVGRSLGAGRRRTFAVSVEGSDAPLVLQTSVNLEGSAVQGITSVGGDDGADDGADGSGANTPPGIPVAAAAGAAVAFVFVVGAALAVFVVRARARKEAEETRAAAVASSSAVSLDGEVPAPPVLEMGSTFFSDLGSVASAYSTVEHE